MTYIFIRFKTRSFFSNKRSGINYDLYIYIYTCKYENREEKVYYVNIITLYIIILSSRTFKCSDPILENT